MRVYLIWACILLFGVTARSQVNYINTCCPDKDAAFTFNGTDSSQKYISIDNMQPQNIWQKGKVYKTTFTTGLTGQKALVTDTVNSYPSNNVSSFQFGVIDCMNLWCGQCCFVQIDIGIFHRYDSEQGKDGGMVEYSLNKGQTWNNIIQPNSIISSITNFYSSSDLVVSLGGPGFSGLSGSGWVASDILLNSAPDTILFRLTFTSDGINSGDGWEIGGIYVTSSFLNSGGIAQFGNKDLITVFPNPSGNYLTVMSKDGSLLKGQISLFNAMGERLSYNGNNSYVDLSGLNSGIYLVKYVEEGKYSIVKVMKE